MLNETNGAIFRQPRHFQLPDAEAAGQAGYLSFVGKYKTTAREPQRNRPIDPAERYPRFGACWPVQVLPPVPVGEKEFQTLLSGIFGKAHSAGKRRGKPERSPGLTWRPGKAAH